MILAGSFAELPHDLPALLTIGTFDGVHRGHRLLLEQARLQALKRRIALVIVTFEPSPALVLRPGLRRYQLCPPDLKIQLLAEFDPACILLLPFTIALSRLSAGEFMDELEAHLAVRELWLGEDFHFGRDREGDARMLAERGLRSGFVLHIVERRADDPGGISSSRIRRALEEGNVELALQLLGYAYRLELADPHGSTEKDDVAVTVYGVQDALSIPATGAYAVFISDAAGQSVPAACLIDAEAPLPVTVVGTHGNQGPIIVEFIARLDGEPSATRTVADLHREAIAVACEWQRPTYPPAGSHT